MDIISDFVCKKLSFSIFIFMYPHFILVWTSEIQIFSKIFDI